MCKAESFRKMEVRGLHELVHDASLRYGSSLAVMFYSSTGASSSLTYEELISSANRLTTLLRENVVLSEHTIGLYCQSDMNLPVWILGILQLPAAYVPLNPDSPPLLTLRIMERCDLTFCVIQSDLFQRFQSDFSYHLSIALCATWSVQRLILVRIKKESSSLQSNSEALQTTKTAETDQGTTLQPDMSLTQKGHQRELLAYVLHTSGTTGNPKIVKVPHKCIVPNILHLRSLFQMAKDDVVFLASPLTFDPSVVEIFLALSSGACLLIVPSTMKKTPNRLAQVLFTHYKTTVLQATPTLLRRFGRNILREKVLCADSSLRVLALGGEVCPSPSLLRNWRQEGNKTQIYNLYGTTEVSCWACYHRIPDSLLCTADRTHTSVPLGEPLLDTAVEVRDENGCRVTEGEGQVFIGGVDRVCLLDDELIITPGTMRSTGDWVKIKDSQMHYLGRRDRLIKRHGQRVNLDTVQQLVENLPMVESCVVGLHESRRLVAFVVPLSGHPLSGRSVSLSKTQQGDQAQDFGSLSRHSISLTKDLPKNSSHSPRDHHGDQTTHVQGDFSSSSEDNRTVSSSAYMHGSKDFIYSNKAIVREVLQSLSKLLASHSIPDTILLVPFLPLTSHGKVDIGKLMKMYERHRDVPVNPSDWKDMDTVKEKLQTLWKEALGLSEDVEITADTQFLLSGGDSLQAVRLYEDISNATGMTSTGLLEAILEGCFTDVLHHVTKVMCSLEQDAVVPPPAKRKHEGTVVPLKRQAINPASTMAKKRTPGSAVPSEKRILETVVVRRAGQIMEIMGCSQSISDMVEPKVIREETLTSHSDLHFHPGQVVRDQEVQQMGASVDSQALDLRVLWSSDTGRCVDASAVLLVECEKHLTSGQTRVTAFIGSHSHRLQALHLTSGEIKWERILGDRLESSATVTKCGTLVVVGCYDKQVYFLHVDSGKTWWTFETGDAVKSSPAVDPETGLVMLGSHDGHIYALEPQVKQCAWKHHCGGGAVFSSPCIHSSLRHLYTATLGGKLLCLSPGSGALLWTHSSGSPFFSSPSCSASCVSIGSVNGNIYGFSHAGEMLWQFFTNGPVFSSPCVWPTSLTDLRTICRSSDDVTSTFAFSQRVVCGSHDGCVYCLSCTDGALLWRFATTGKVFSSPFVFDGSPWGFKTLVAFSSTDGAVWVLDGENGTLKASLSLPGELFSSPVVWGHTLVVGCRNDYVYAIELTKRRESPRGSMVG